MKTLSASTKPIALRSQRQAAKTTASVSIPKATMTSSSPRVSTTRRASRGVVVAAALSTSSPSPTSSPSSSPPSTTPFDWSAAWYPVGSLLSTLDESRPNRVTLLGKELVVWLDGSGEGGAAPTWRAALDECPHRLAPMSEGRLEDGVLSCRYHGWAFGGERGACIACPQAPTKAAEATVLSSPRSRMRSLPARAAQGLLFVWPKEGEEAARRAAETPLPLFFDDDENGGGGNAAVGGMNDWGFQRPPLDFLLMLENAFDPSHASFLHETTMGPNTRAAASPMTEFRASGLTDKGFFVEHGGYTKSQVARGMKATRTFHPPSTVVTRYAFDGTDDEAVAVLYFVPDAPGTATVLAKFASQKKKRAVSAAEEEKEEKKGTAPARDAWRDDVIAAGASGGDSSSSSSDNKKFPLSRSKAPSLFSRLRTLALNKLFSSSLAHVLGQSLADQDTIVVHGVYRRLLEREASGASRRGYRSYWLATPSDVGVRALHEWLEKFARGGPWGPDLGASQLSTSSAAAANNVLKPLSRKELLNHWERHTKHCKVCLKALERLEITRALVAVAGLVATAAASASAVIAAALALSSSAASAPPPSSPLTVEALARVGLPSLAVAVACGLLWKSLGAWKQRFYFAEKLADEK